MESGIYVEGVFMKCLRITYVHNDKMLKEATEMADFLRENGVRTFLGGFEHSPGESFDEIQAMAYIAPIIEAQIIPASCPHDSYVKGLEGAKKYIELIKKYYARFEANSEPE